MTERLTKKDKPILKNQLEDNMSVNKNTAIKRLWQYENVMEKYGIESFELLEHIIKKGKVINSVIEGFAKEEYDKMKQDRDTWKKTCELIVKELNKLNTDKCKFCCYQESNKDYGSCDCDEQFELDRTINYFYQQAKKEKK